MTSPGYRATLDFNGTQLQKPVDN